ncbi:MAG: sugar ABC transporter ATP-binding protein [Bradyrhizobium sp.]|nr:sugar ABC transporter ATP-binding protein [Bradyrhizobium sp.]
MPETPEDFLLSLHGISKAFGATVALKAVDFTLRAGEIHAICGENGAGKSTLIKVLAGVIRADAGELVVGGRRVEVNTPRLALQNGIATIYQENSLFQYLSVAENIFLGDEPRRFPGVVDHRAMRARAQAILDRLGTAIDVSALVSSLGGAGQKIVEIARAFRRNARILVMDEPSASFSHHETRLLFRAVREMAASGAGIIFISHHLEEVFEIADRVTTLRDGRHVSTRALADMTEAGLIRDMVGRDVDQIYRRVPQSAGAMALETRHLTGKGFRDVGITVRRGEVVGIAGLVGAGRTELLEAIFGRFPVQAGEIRLNGRPVRISSPGSAIRYGLCLVTEDRKLSGLFLDQSVTNNMAIAYFSKFPALLDKAALLRKLALGAIKQLGIKVSSPETLVSALSGGNQQKVILGKWLLTGPDIFLFDEPTRGIDVGAKAEIYAEIQKLVENGKSVLMVSSELPEIVGLSDRVYVMKASRVVGELSRDHVTDQAVLELAL